MRKFIAVLIAATAMFALASVGPTGTNRIWPWGATTADAFVSGNTTFDDCASDTALLGARVCFDADIGYFSIYSDASTLAISFPSNSGYTTATSGYSGYVGIWTNWSALSGTVTYAQDSTGEDVVTSNAGCYDSYKSICVYGGNHDHLVWWSAQANVEFVVVRGSGTQECHIDGPSGKFANTVRGGNYAETHLYASQRALDVCESSIYSKYGDNMLSDPDSYWTVTGSSWVGSKHRITFSSYWSGWSGWVEVAVQT